MLKKINNTELRLLLIVNKKNNNYLKNCNGNTFKLRNNPKARIKIK